MQKQTNPQLVPGHKTLMNSALAVLMAATVTDEIAALFLANIRLRCNDIVPSKDKLELMKIVAAAGMRMTDDYMLNIDVQEFLDGQIGRQGVEAIVAEADGWRVVDTACEHGYHVIFDDDYRLFSAAMRSLEDDGSQCPHHPMVGGKTTLGNPDGLRQLLEMLGMVGAPINKDFGEQVMLFGPISDRFGLDDFERISLMEEEFDLLEEAAARRVQDLAGKTIGERLALLGKGSSRSEDGNPERPVPYVLRPPNSTKLNLGPSQTI